MGEYAADFRRRLRRRGVDDRNAKMAALAAVSPLPHSPDREAIGTLCEALLREGLGLQGRQGVQDVN